MLKSIRRKALVVLVMGLLGLQAQPAGAEPALRGTCANLCQYMVSGCSGSPSAAEWCTFWFCFYDYSCDVGDCTYPDRRIRCCDEQGGCLTAP
jgi:hypothetical protein